MPAVVGFLIALVAAFIQNRKRTFQEKLMDVTQNMGDSNVMIMCLVFILAGGFSGAVQAAGGVDSTVNLSLIHIFHDKRYQSDILGLQLDGDRQQADHLRSLSLIHI